MAVLAPISSAGATTATAVKLGFQRSTQAVAEVLGEAGERRGMRIWGMTRRGAEGYIGRRRLLTQIEVDIDGLLQVHRFEIDPARDVAPLFDCAESGRHQPGVTLKHLEIAYLTCLGDDRKQPDRPLDVLSPCFFRINRPDLANEVAASASTSAKDAANHDPRTLRVRGQRFWGRRRRCTSCQQERHR